MPDYKILFLLDKTITAIETGPMFEEIFVPINGLYIRKNKGI